MTEAKTSNYWISPTALRLSLNALGNPDYLQGSTSSGASILCYIKDIITYDDAHNYRAWTLQLYPTVFASTSIKYVYVKIPRDLTKTTALVCFPSVQIDLYGKSYSETTAEDGTKTETETQVGSEDYYYINLQGIISASVDENGATCNREFTHAIDYGSLDTAEARDAAADSEWYEYDAASGIVTFLKNLTFKAGQKFLNLFTRRLTFKDDAEADKGTLESVPAASAFDITGNGSATEAVSTEYLKAFYDKLGNDIFLRKDQDDETNYKLTLAEVDVKGLLQAFSDLQVFSNLRSNKWNGGGMSTGTGWNVDNSGNAELQSLKVRGALHVLELVYNRLSAEESDFVFTESGTIETATLIEEGNYAGCYKCTIRKKTDTDFTAFQVGDVCKGVVNDLTDTTVSVGKSSYTSWVLVKYVDTTDNYIIVSVYGDNEVPDGTNYPPTDLMVLHRWGNALEANESNYKLYEFIEPVYASDGITIKGYNNTRQSCWYISSLEKRIVMLDGVDNPIIKEKNYAAFFGLPYNMTSFADKAVNVNQPYIYCRGAFFENIYHIDYKGNVIKSERFRGLWSATTAEGDDPYVLTDTTYDTVYYNNAKWQCVATTAGTEPPSQDNGDWLKLYDGIVPKYTIVPSVTRVIRDAEGNPNVSEVTCDVILEDATGNTAPVLQDEKKVYFTKNKLESSLEAGRTVSISKGDGTNTIEFYLYNNDSALGSMNFGDSTFAYLTGKVTVEVIMQGDVSIVTDVEVKYAVTDEYITDPSTISEDTSVTPHWQDGMPTVETGKFLWIWTHTEYNDREDVDQYSVSRVGIDGNGVKDSNIKYYQTTDENTIDPETIDLDTDVDPHWEDDMPATLVPGHWLYTRTWIQYSDNKETTDISVVQLGIGSSYAGCKEYYALGASGDTAPAGYPDAKTYVNGETVSYESPWSETKPTEQDWKDSVKEDDPTPYIWNFEISHDSAGNKYVTAPVCIGNFSKGIKSIVEAYAISAYSAPDVEGADYPSDIVEVEEGEEAPEGKHTWTDEQQDAAPTEDYPYQWNKTETTYTDGTTEYHYHVSAVKGDDAVNVVVTGTNITTKKSSSAQTFNVYVNATKGSTQLASTEVQCSPLDDIEGLSCEICTDDTNDVNYYKLTLAADTLVNATIPFTVVIGSVDYNYEIVFSTVEDGESIQGPRGATIRTSEFAEGVSYLNGETDARILDVVWISGSPSVFYYCITSHVSAEGEDPKEDAEAGSSAVNWKTFDHFEAIATKILFAERGKIDNADLTNVTLRGTITEDTEETLDYFHVVGTGCTNKYEDGKNYTLKSVYVNNAMTEAYVLDDNGDIQYDEGLPLTDGEDFSSNRIIMLPTYEGMAINNEIVVPSYQNAGAHLNIYSTPINDVMNWSICDETDWQQQYKLLKTLFDKAVLVCADPCSLISNGDGGVKAGWNNSQVFDTYNEDYVQGRFSWNGVMARCLILLPGQNLHLISSVQEVTMTTDEGDKIVKTLVWNIDNSSDFQGINVHIYEGTSVNYSISSVPTHISGVAGNSSNAILLSGKGFQWDEKALSCPMSISVTPIDGETQQLPKWSVDTFEITTE